MKCYYDQQIFLTQASGGISRYFFEVIRCLGVTRTIHPTIFAGWYASRLPLHRLAHCRVYGLPRRVRIGPLWPVVNLACVAANERLLRVISPDIYHPTYYRPSARPARTRMVVTVYDMIHEKFPELCPRDNTKEFKHASCEQADAIICISESTRQDLLSYYPKFAAKTSVVHLAVNPDFDAVRNSPASSNLSFPYALFVGSRKGYKGFSLALRAWKEIAPMHPELHLICVGGGVFTASEKSEIQRQGLSALVSQREADDGQLATLYHQAVLFVYPSVYEGFGLPILEAMACGCPVVCSRSSSLPEIGGEAALYFEPGDSASLAAKLSEIYGDEGCRTRLIRMGYEQRQRFSWTRCAQQTADIYQRCV